MGDLELDDVTLLHGGDRATGAREDDVARFQRDARSIGATIGALFSGLLILRSRQRVVSRETTRQTTQASELANRDSNEVEAGV